MFLSLQTILFCMMMACGKENLHTLPGNTNTGNNDTTMTDSSAKFTWLALGDSYTIGEAVANSERFPAQTAFLLQKDAINFKSIQYIARTGWTTLNLLDAINQQKPDADFSIVTLLIGVNDQYQREDTSGYRDRFTQCLQKAIELAGVPERVFVLSIPDYSVTPFAQYYDTAMISKQIDAFNAINKEVTTSFQINYTDITPLTREAKNDPSLIAQDGLHPSGKEYAKWAALLAPKMKKVLQ